MGELSPKKIPIDKFTDLRFIDNGADSFVYKTLSGERVIKIYSNKEPEFFVGAFNMRSVRPEQLQLYCDVTNKASGFLIANQERVQLPNCLEKIEVNPVLDWGYHKGAGLLWSESLRIRGRELNARNPSIEEISEMLSRASDLLGKVMEVDGIHIISYNTRLIRSKEKDVLIITDLCTNVKGLKRMSNLG